ncbi:hypothetical protein PIB30_107402, partial [Stylosanthes scabra]|nr:hypothetical protein [Stylosanthes scabra]
MPEEKQTIPPYCVSKQTGRARKTAGQFSQDAVKHPPVHFSCKKGALIPRTEEKIPSLDQDEAATLSTP